VKSHVIPQLVIELLERGLPVSFGEMVDGSPTYNVDGFYKSGTVNLRPCDNGELLCVSRYDETECVGGFSDILRINLDWWRRSKHRYDGWSSPDHRWLPHLVEAGLVKEKQKLVHEYEEA